MPFRTLHPGEGGQRVLACERSHQGFSCESGAMPSVNGCRKQDYTVLIVVGLPATH